ncbi:MAG: hypothetical protein A2157_16520 [Deltaproteobacteria bacterium RBG_16_47_11]|nr:MAG: hypothetical protein A2157_16520 [Deltaproteobacteria bacterium RBG_16_47_11]
MARFKHKEICRGHGCPYEVFSLVLPSIFNEAILDMMKKLNIHEYVDCQRICAEDEDGKHFGSRYWPKTDCILSAPMSDKKQRSFSMRF